MPATTSDEAALLAAIAAHPEEDSVRLAYADWLDEQGDERVTCWRCGGDGVHTVLFNGKPDPAMKGRRACGVCSGKGHILDTSRRDRAELIRVQVELEGRKSLGDGRTHKLLNRESALLDAHPEWLPECPFCRDGKQVRLDPDMFSRGLPSQLQVQCPHCSGTARGGDMRRGFVHEVRVPTLATVLERPLCPKCHRLGVFGAWPTCGGSGYQTPTHVPTDYARDLLDRFPTVRSVVPLDRVPLRLSGATVHIWVAPTSPLEDRPHFLPLPVFQKLPVAGDSKEFPLCGAYTTPEAALAALGVAVADVLRPG